MKLNISPKVERYLVEKGMVDDRKIWCYAYMKAVIKLQEDPVKLYGLTLVCISQDDLVLYNTEINSTKLDRIYTCKISEMKNVRVKKIFCGLRKVLSFSKGEESFQLEMDEWKRFSDVFKM